jgi:CheY-like chemotaxis protein
MKTAQELSKADSAKQLSHELRRRLHATIESAECLKLKLESDENVQRILTTTRELLDLISREARKPSGGDDVGRSESNKRYDVLYVEDDPITFSSVNLLLRSKRKFKVVQATSGKTGIALARTHHPRLILLDLDLPDIHGSEVIQHLLKDPATARIPVVVISGDSTPSQIERLLVLGARNYLTKPFEVDPFLAVVDGVMQESAAAGTS